MTRLGELVEAFTAEQIRLALLKAGTKEGAARVLGCSRDTVIKYVKNHPEIFNANLTRNVGTPPPPA